jgi:ABC-type multidrug transport system fused ATPase/permease subunit
MSESCDTALAEYQLRQLELADAFAAMLAMAAAATVSAVLLLAAIGILIAASAVIGTPAGLVSWIVILGAVGVAVLTAAMFLFSFVMLVSAYLEWRAAMDRRQRAYADLFAKCQNEPDRIPPPPIG